MRFKYLKIIFYDKERYFQEEYNMFDEYLDVPGLLELRDFIVSFRENSLLKDFNNVVESIFNPNSPSFKRFSFKIKLNNFILQARKILRVPKIPIHIPYIHDLIDFNCIDALLMLIEFNYHYYTPFKIHNPKKAIEYILSGDIIVKISLLVEDYKNDETVSYDKTFFKKLKNIYFADKRAEKLEDLLRGGYLTQIVIEQKLTIRFYNHIKFSALYLMACSAIKNGHEGITCEDVVVGYMLTLKMFTEDLRADVRKAYNESIN